MNLNRPDMTEDVKFKNYTNNFLQKDSNPTTMEVVTQTNAVKSPTDSPATTKLVYTVEEIARMLAISLRSAYNLCNSTTDFRFLQLLFVDRQVSAFLILQLHDLGNDGIHGSIIFHQLHGFGHYQIFQPLFPHCLFITGLFLLGSSTLVVGIHFPGVADTAFSEHQCTALAAVQLGGEQIAFLCLMTGRGFFVFRQLFLHLVEQVRVCAAKRSNESPSGAFKRQNGLA